MKFDHARITNVVMRDVHLWDMHDFCDAYVESADYNGRPMTEQELEELNKDGEFVNQQAHESLY